MHGPGYNTSLHLTTPHNTSQHPTTPHNTSQHSILLSTRLTTALSVFGMQCLEIQNVLLFHPVVAHECEIHLNTKDLSYIEGVLLRLTVLRRMITCESVQDVGLQAACERILVDHMACLIDIYAKHENQLIAFTALKVLEDIFSISSRSVSTRTLRGWCRLITEKLSGRELSAVSYSLPTIDSAANPTSNPATSSTANTTTNFITNSIANSATNSTTNLTPNPGINLANSATDPTTNPVITNPTINSITNPVVNLATNPVNLVIDFVVTNPATNPTTNPATNPTNFFMTDSSTPYNPLTNPEINLSTNCTANTINNCCQSPPQVGTFFHDHGVSVLTIALKRIRKMESTPTPEKTALLSTIVDELSLHLESLFTLFMQKKITALYPFLALVVECLKCYNMRPENLHASSSADTSIPIVICNHFLLIRKSFTTNQDYSIRKRLLDLIKHLVDNMSLINSRLYDVVLTLTCFVNDLGQQVEVRDEEGASFASMPGEEGSDILWRLLLVSIMKLMLHLVSVLERGEMDRKRNRSTDLDKTYSDCLELLLDKAELLLEGNIETNLRERFFALFNGQDDHMIQMLNGIQALYISVQKPSERLLPIFHTHASLLDTFIEWLHPHSLFIHFMDTIGYDDSVLLDFLISSETEFLPYFTRYLHFLIAEWVHCVAITNQQVNIHADNEEEIDILESLLTTFSTLRGTIEGLTKNKLFPRYNARPLIVLLQQLENKYSLHVLDI